MNHCERFMDLLSQSLDGPLPLEDHQALQQHLEQCPECRLLSQQFLEIREEFHSWEDQEVPEGFTAVVMDRIRAAEEKPKVIPIWKHRQFKTFGSIAACALICMGLWRTGAPEVSQDAAFAPAASAPAAETMDVHSYVTADSAAVDGAPAPAALAKSAEDAPAQDASASLTVHAETASLPDEDQLIRLVQDTLGQVPGTLVLVDTLPQIAEGTLYTAADGTQLLVLSAQPEAGMWKTLAESASFCLELGDGPMVFMTTN